MGPRSGEPAGGRRTCGIIQGGDVSEFLRPIAEWCAAIIEAIGIGIIALIALYALFDAAIRLLRKEETERIFMELRQQLGRGILIGLEFLIAADIIHTVAVELTCARS